jgi:hypothetical protein
MTSRTVALFVALAIAFTACDSGGDRTDPSIVRSPRPSRGSEAMPPLKIGLVGTMTGSGGWRGEDAFEGADLALHVLNRNVGDGERRYELEVLDDRGDEARSLDLLGDLLRRGDTVGIVFAGPSRVLVDAEAALRRAKVPAILLYGDLYGGQQLTPHVFQASPPFVWQARDIARYIARDRGYEKIGVLTEAGTLEGSLASRAARDALHGYAVDRVVRATYQADVRPGLDRLRKQRVEALIVQGQPLVLERIYGEIAEMRATYRNSRAARIASLENRRIRQRRQRTGWWRPQLFGFDAMMNERVAPPPPGTMATGTYARGVHYLPIPSFQRFRRSFEGWWDSPPRGYEQRGYEATLALGWAAERAGDDDIAPALERLRSRRFGGLPVTLGPDDHLLVEEVTIGLWTVPFPGDRVGSDPPREFPWVPLARGFSINGETTDILSRDWRSLFRDPPPHNGPAPRFRKMKFGVTTPRSDPLR